MFARVPCEGNEDDAVPMMAPAEVVGQATDNPLTFATRHPRICSLPMIKEWRLRAFSLAGLYHVLLIPMGVLGLIIGATNLIKTSPPMDSGSRVYLTLIGFWFVVVSGISFYFPATKISLLGDGAINFVSRRRTLHVNRGELISVKKIWMDPHRLLPLRVKTTAGTIYVSALIRDVEGLQEALLENSPNAQLCRLTPRFS